MIGPWIDGVRESDHWPKFLSLGFNIIWEIFSQMSFAGESSDLFFLKKKPYTNFIDMTINKSTKFIKHQLFPSNLFSFLLSFKPSLKQRLEVVQSCFLYGWSDERYPSLPFEIAPKALQSAIPRYVVVPRKNSWHFEKTGENPRMVCFNPKKSEEAHKNWERAMKPVIRLMLIFIDSMNSPSAKCIVENSELQHV